MKQKLPTRVVSFGTLKPLAKKVSSLLRQGSVVVWDQGLDTHYGSLLLGERCLRIKGGERSKTWEQLGWILARLNELNLERRQTLIVVGGGAVCDLGAMAAALHRRGVPLILVPTTLLAQVDASLGGKAAVDLVHEGLLVKNAAGVFYPASQVWICPVWLQTLSERELRSGEAELAKIFWLMGKKRGGVVEALRLKRAIVERDPLDLTGYRAQLNFGHTIGHALESLSRGRLSHGEAIAWGMWAECEYARSPMAREIFAFLCRGDYPWPRFARNVGFKAWYSLYLRDKKVSGELVALQTLNAPGCLGVLKVKPEVLAHFSVEIFSKTLVL